MGFFFIFEKEKDQTYLDVLVIPHFLRKGAQPKTVKQKLFTMWLSINRLGISMVIFHISVMILTLGQCEMCVVHSV